MGVFPWFSKWATPKFYFEIKKKFSLVFSASETPIQDCTLKFQNSSEMKHPSKNFT